MGMVLLLVLLQSLWLRSVYCNVGLDGAGDLFKFVTVSTIRETNILERDFGYLSDDENRGPIS